MRIFLSENIQYIEALSLYTMLTLTCTGALVQIKVIKHMLNHALLKHTVSSYRKQLHYACILFGNNG